MKIASKFLAITLALGSFSIGSLAHADSSEADWNRLIFSVSLSAITFFPTIITAGGIAATTDGACRCRDIPFKIAFVKQAAVEAAEYVAGGDMGPNLDAFIKGNPDRKPEELVDAVLELAEQL